MEDHENVMYTGLLQEEDLCKTLERKFFAGRAKLPAASGSACLRNKVSFVGQMGNEDVLGGLRYSRS